MTDHKNGYYLIDVPKHWMSKPESLIDPKILLKVTGRIANQCSQYPKTKMVQCVGFVFSDEDLSSRKGEALDELSEFVVDFCESDTEADYWNIEDLEEKDLVGSYKESLTSVRAKVGAYWVKGLRKYQGGYWIKHSSPPTICRNKKDLPKINLSESRKERALKGDRLY